MTLDLELTKDQGSFLLRAVPADNSFWKAGGQITPLGPPDWSLVSARRMEFGKYEDCLRSERGDFLLSGVRLRAIIVPSDFEVIVWHFN